jgi:hypothetical protein
MRQPKSLTLCGLDWGERRGLNPRPSVPQTDALPAELRSPQALSMKIFLLLAVLSFSQLL